MQHSIFFILLTVTCSSPVHTARIVVFLLQQRLRERARILRYTYITYLVHVNKRGGAHNNHRDFLKC